MLCSDCVLAKVVKRAPCLLVKRSGDLWLEVWCALIRLSFVNNPENDSDTSIGEIYVDECEVSM